VSRKIDFGGRDWTAHAQDHWLELAGKPYFPDYLRVVFVAYGNHRANGHAKLARGDLAAYLVRANGTLPDRRTIYRAIGKAIEFGFLREESRQLCLVVSSLHVQGGLGDPDKPCPRDHTRRSKDVTTGSRSASKDYLSAGRSSANDYSTGSRSTLSPSLSSTSPTTADREVS
jgi:hypothetical protein